MLALALKNLSEGNMGDQKMLRLFYFSIYAWKHYIMNILDSWLHWKRFNGIICTLSLGIEKICRREIRAIKRCCGCFLCSFMFRITIYWTYLMVVLIGNWIASVCQPWLWKICWREKRDQKKLRLIALSVYVCWFWYLACWRRSSIKIRLTKSNAEKKEEKKAGA